MRLLALLAAAVGTLLAANAAQAADAPWPDGARYDLALAFDAGRRALTGTEDVSFVNTGPAPLERVWLRVWANGPSGCARPLARVDVESGGTAAGTAAGCTALRIDLAAPLAPGASGTLRLRLDVRVPLRNDRFGRSGGAYLLGNAIPVLAPEDAAGPRLVPYSDLGDSFYSLTAAWRLVLDVPAGLEAAATGTETAPREPLPDGGWRIVSEAPAARDLAIAIGPYAVSTRQVGNVEVRVLRLRGARPAVGARLLRQASRAVETYTRWYGRLGAAPGGPVQLDVVQTRFAEFGGMEYPELIMVVDDPLSVAHEVAHQWFYGLVGSDEWRQPWLDESLATFAQRRLLNTIGACDVQRPLGLWPGARLGDDMAAFERQPELYGAVYDGGACALQALRAAWGDQRFARLLRTWVAEHRMGVATTADFAALVRRLAPPRYKVVRWFERSRLDVSTASP